MNSDDLRGGGFAGLLAATSTAGTLVAIGLRSGSAAQPFNSMAAHLLGRARANVWGFVPSVTLPGIAVHLFLTTLLGVLVALIVRRRLAPAWVMSVAASLLSALVSIGIARRGGVSLARLLSFGDLAVFYLTLAISLTLGIRFAFSRPPKDGRRVESM